MKLGLFSLRSAASFRNQADLIRKASVKEGWEVDDRDLVERANWPKERWDRVIILAPLWPRYVIDSVRLACPWLTRGFWLYGPVDGPYTLNVTFLQVVKATILERRLAVPSEFCRRMMIRSDLNPGAVIPHGVDPEHFKFEAEQGRSRIDALRKRWPGRKILFSNLNPLHRKGFPHLAKALMILNQKRPGEWVFILHTGKASALKHFSKLDRVPNLIIEDAYNKLPFREIVLKTLSCDVFVMPTLNEGFGLPILEAMACRRVIVVQDAPAMNELVSSKEAWLFPNRSIREESWPGPGCVAQLHEYDPGDLAQAIMDAVDNPKVSEEKSARAYARSKEYHYRRVYAPLVKR